MLRHMPSASSPPTGRSPPEPAVPPNEPNHVRGGGLALSRRAHENLGTPVLDLDREDLDPRLVHAARPRAEDRRAGVAADLLARRRCEQVVADRALVALRSRFLEALDDARRLLRRTGDRLGLGLVPAAATSGEKAENEQCPP